MAKHDRVHGYREGDVDTSIDGYALMWEDTSDTLRAVSAAKPLPIEIVSGSSSGTEYTEDAAAPSDPVGGAVLLVRDDSPVTVAADGDWVAQRATQYGAAYAQIVDSSGSFIDTFGGGTQYTEADTDATITGTVTMWEDTSDTIRAASAANPFPVEIIAGAGSGGTASTDDAAFTIASGSGTPAMGLRDDSGDTVDDHDVGVLRMTSDRQLLVTEASGASILSDTTAILADTANMDTNLATIAGDTTSLDGKDLMLGSDFSDVLGTASLVDGSNHLQVDIAADSVGIGGGTQHAVDDALGATPTGTLAIGIRDDALTTLTPVEGDAVGLRVDATGALWVATDDTLTVDGSGVTQPVSGTVTANLGATDNAVLDAIQAAVETIDNAIAGSEMQVDIVAGGFDGVVTNAGTFATQVDGDALTALQLIDDPVATISSTPLQRVAIFDDSDSQITSFGGGTQHAVDDALGSTPTGTLSIGIRDDALSALTPVEGDAVGLRVDSTGALWVATDDTIAVSNAGLTELAAAINSSELDVNIATDSAGIGGGTQYTEDDVVPANPVGTAPIAQRDDALGGLTPAEGDWTHLFTDANGALWVIPSGTVTVDGSGVTQPVSGTVTANLGATDNAVLDAIQAAVETIDNAIAGSEMQVDIVAGGFDGAVTNAGTFATQVDGDALTALQLIDNIVQTEDSVHGTGDSGVMALAVRQDSQVDFGADGDYVPFSINADGELRVTTAGGSAPSHTDDAAFTVATDNVSPIGALLDDTATDSVDEGDVGVLRMSADRRLYVDADITAQSVGDITIADGGNVISTDWNGTAPPIGAGTEAAALRVTLATDSTGVVSIDDNGSTISVDDGSGSLTVDGTVTANLGATDNAVLDNIDTATTNLPTVLGSGAIVAAHDATHPANALSVGGVAVDLAEDPTAVAKDDLSEAKMTRDGQLLTFPGHPNPTVTEWYATGAFTDDIVVAAPGAGSRLVVTGVEIAVDNAATTDPDVRLGFGANVPTEPTTGNSTTGVCPGGHPGIAAGSGTIAGFAGAAIAVGGDAEPLRVTNTTPTAGGIRIYVQHYTLDG